MLIRLIVFSKIRPRPKGLQMKARDDSSSAYRHVVSCVSEAVSWFRNGLLDELYTVLDTAHGIVDEFRDLQRLASRGSR